MRKNIRLIGWILVGAVLGYAALIALVMIPVLVGASGLGNIGYMTIR